MLRSRYERLLGPVCIVLLLGTLGYPGGVRDIIGGSLVHRLACRLESRQITELSKASTLLRLHELLHPRVRVIDHLPAQLRRNLVHRLSRLSGCLVDAAAAGRLTSDQRLGEGPDEFDWLQLADIRRSVDELMACVVEELLWDCSVDLRMLREMFLRGCLELLHRRPARLTTSIRTELARWDGASALDSDAADIALAKEVGELALLLVGRREPVWAAVMVVLRIVEHEVHLLAGVQLPESGEEALLDPSMNFSPLMVW